MPPLLHAASAALFALACALAGHARAGVVLSNTRVVVSGDAREATVRLTNTRAKPVLVEAWIEPGVGTDARDPTSNGALPFEIVPPLFRMEPGHGQALRVHRVPAPVAEDRETQFWLNVYEMPAVSGDSDANAMHITVRTRVKLFLRPAGLPGSAAKAPDRLTWRLLPRGDGGAALRIDNPTPYHVTVSRIALGDDALDLRGDMVPPFGRRDLALDTPTFDGSVPQPGRRMQALRAMPRVEFLFLNDSGGAERRSAALASTDAP